MGPLAGHAPPGVQIPSGPRRAFRNPSGRRPTADNDSVSSARRIGLIVLGAVAGAIIGGALAARDPQPPALPLAPPAPQPRPRRSLARLAAGAAIVVALAITVALVTKPATTDRQATPHLVTTPSPGPHGMDVMVTVPGRIGRDERATLSGDDGTRVEISTRLDLEQPSYDNPGERVVFFKVHVHNIGPVAIVARLARDAWVLDSAGGNHRGDYLRSQMVDVSENPPRLEPGWEIDLTAGFPVPEDATLTRLHIGLPIGGSTPTAEWNLQG